MSGATPKMDPRDARAFVETLLDRRPGYVPGWQPEPGGPSWAVIEAFGRYLQTLAERINAAPDKNLLALLDRLGVNLLPAQAARAPVVFALLPNAGNSRAPAGTRVGAKAAGSPDPIVFETATSIGLAGARLTDVVSVWPARDAVAVHSAAAASGQPFTLFQPLAPIPHALYLAHNVHFAMDGEATINIRVEMDAPAARPVALVWEYWDGKVWREFKPFVAPADASERDSLDGTEGLTRSGIVRLTADCATSEKTRVDSVEAHWIRARAAQPIVRADINGLPSIDRISIQTVLVRFAGSLVAGPDDPREVGVVVRMYDAAGAPWMTSATAELRGPIGSQAPTSIDDNELRWESPPTGGDYPGGDYRLRIAEPGFAPLEVRFAMPPDPVGFKVTQELGDSLPQIAFADGQKLDLTKSFYPFGQQPQPGAAFYIGSAMFGKPGAEITLIASDAITPQENQGGITSSPELVLESWNGSDWREIAPSAGKVDVFILQGGALTFDLPLDVTQTTVNGEKAFWLRVRLVADGFYRTNTISWWVPEIEKENTINVIETVPPALGSLAIASTYRSPWAQLQWCYTHNDFQWEDHSEDAAWSGDSFAPFRPTDDATPTLYLGFDQPLPADLVSLYLGVVETEECDRGPQLAWEYWNGSGWRALSVRDETANLALPGMVEALWPGVPAPPPARVANAAERTVTLATARDADRFAAGDRLYIERDGAGELVTVDAVDGATLTLKTALAQAYTGAAIGRPSLPRFGVPRTWLRARLQVDGDPLASTVDGIHLNATWAAQVETIDGEVLGGSNEQPGQLFLTRRAPVLPGEIVQVRELEGRRAAIELPILIDELRAHGLPETAVEPERDQATGRVTAAWVTWKPRPHLLFSGPGDRHYTIERSGGRLIFGDGVNGRIPPPGTDNVRLKRYRAGGGEIGNVPAGAITQLLGAVPLAQGVTNPRAAEGGATGETVDGVRERGPHVLRHRNQAISLADYEDLAREASPAVAVARALPTTRRALPGATGWVTLIVMPQSDDPRPQPSFELRRLVRDYVAARAPAGMRARLIVTGPAYRPIGVAAAVVPIDRSNAGPVGEAATTALERFLHPLTGGPDARGWPFGRDVYLSDIAATLESLPGVDYVRTLNLLLDGTPAGERIDVPPDRIVVAGTLRITVAGRED